MKKPGKAFFLALAAILAVALAAGAAWRYRLPARPAVPCAQQQPAQFSAACLAQAQAGAARGERAAMVALAAYFDPREPAQARRWTLGAARLGEPGAIARVLAACGAGKPYTEAEAQALLPLAPALDALHFRLGGSCAAPDMAAARALKAADVLAAPDGAALCKVAVRYGALRLSRAGAQLDAQAAQQLLAECERRTQVAPAARQEAASVRQMLAREIRPVHISVD